MTVRRVSNIRFIDIILFIVLSLIIIYLWFDNDSSVNFLQTLTSINYTSTKVKTCEYPIVYNKPPKTASSKIGHDIKSWSQEQHRSYYKCSPFINRASFEMRECIPTDKTGCAVISTHVILSDMMKEILTKKIGKFLLITSTRDPRKRMMSMYMQDRRLEWPIKQDILPDLKRFIRNRNPWELYNYHTGKHRVGSCPISQADRAIVRDMVNQADIVIDADLTKESNTILKYHNVFQLSDKEINVRGSKEIQLDKEGKELLKNVTCVDEEMHRLYRLRMASVYGKSTNTKCIKGGRIPSHCFNETAR